MYFFWGSNLFRVYNQKSKTFNNRTCLGEPPGGFCDVSCHFIFVSSFCCCSSFVNVLHSHFLFGIIPHPSVDYRRGCYTPFYTFSPAHCRVIHDTFHFQPFCYLLTASATVLSGHFLPTGVFYLTLLPSILGTTCFYQGLPGSRQLFFEICRASYWSLKHRPCQSICLIHRNPQSFIHLKFVFIHVNIAKVFTCGENFDKKYRSATRLFSSHKNINQQPH